MKATPDIRISFQSRQLEPQRSFLCLHKPAILLGGGLSSAARLPRRDPPRTASDAPARPSRCRRSPKRAAERVVHDELAVGVVRAREVLEPRCRRRRKGGQDVAEECVAGRERELLAQKGHDGGKGLAAGHAEFVARCLPRGQLEPHKGTE